MAMTPDQLLDRKRLKTRIMQWRLFAVLALLAVVLVALGEKGVGGVVDHHYIARLSVSDIMVDDPVRDDLVAQIANDKHARAAIIWMDSPGGEGVAGEELYHGLRTIAEKKPVIVVMRALCASACYMAALGADHLLARESTLTGSVGVMLESVEVSRLADKLGITPVTIKSGAMKDVPSLTRPITEEERAEIQSTVDDTYNFFVGLMAERRKFPQEKALELADGRIYSGHQAYKNGLIDGLGGEAEARTWLEKTHNIPADLEMRDIEPEPDVKSFLSKLEQLTLAPLRGALAVPLDGVVSIWHL
jgi:protease-4